MKIVYIVYSQGCLREARSSQNCTIKNVRWAKSSSIFLFFFQFRSVCRHLIETYLRVYRFIKSFDLFEVMQYFEHLDQTLFLKFSRIFGVCVNLSTSLLVSINFLS